uniref:Ion transport domain-containing protein n=1 Tax=Meloidogyne incognita TaxID=6306 RepID=A0A914NCG9_MELIC
MKMKWQRKLQNRQLLSYFTKRLHIWSRICFFLSVLLNLILAISYPFEHSQNFGQSLFLSADNPFIYLSFLVALLYFFFCCSPEWHSVGLSFCSQISLFLAMFSSSILSTALFGLLPTLWILGILQFVVKCIHITSYSGNKGFVEDHNWKQILSDSTFLYHLAYLICCLLGLLIHPFIYSLLLFDVIACEETLQNVIRSVTRNWQSIFLTGLLALILVYHFSIIGYLFFQRDFRLEVHKLTDSEEEMENKCLNENNYFYKDYLKEEENKQKCEEKNNLIEEDDELELKVPSCETLRMCILTTLNWGLRNGGGIGDVLRSVSPHEPYFFWRILYDMTFYIVLIIIVLNLIFGVIIDTFGDLRTEKNEKEFTLRNTCFICGLERGKFDNKSVQVTFDEHNEREHNLWHYIYFIVWLQIKDETEFTGPESFVSICVKNHNMDWFPRMQAISLQKENENNLEEN